MSSKRFEWLSRFRRLRLLRRRATISATRMSIKTHVPWYYRLPAWGLVLAIGLAGAKLIYEEGRKIAGFSADQVQDELKSQTAKIAELTEENRRLRADSNAANAKIQIELTTREQVAAQIKALEASNAKLRDELSFFESVLASGKQQPAMTINGFKFEADPAAPNQFRYRLMLARDARQGGFAEGKAEPEFNGHLQFVLTLVQDGKSAIVSFPDAKAGKENEPHRVRFKYFERAEGVLNIPVGARVKQVQVKVMEGSPGSTTVRATQSINIQ